MRADLLSAFRQCLNPIKLFSSQSSVRRLPEATLRWIGNAQPAQIIYNDLTFMKNSLLYHSIKKACPDWAG